MTWRASLVLVALIVACGDAGVPPPSADGFPGPVDDGTPREPGDDGTSPEPEGWRIVDLHGDSAIKLNPGHCWTPHDCEAGESCMHGEFFLTRTIPGVCMLRPASELMGLLTISPVRFTDGGSSPETDDFVVEPGAFDGTLMVDQDGHTQAFDAPGVPLPFELGAGFEFSWQVGIHIRVVDPNDPGYDIECNVAFLRSGDVVGGVIREPGKVLCSTNNWQPPQNPGAPGLLLEYEQCAWSDRSWSGSLENCPLN